VHGAFSSGDGCTTACQEVAGRRHIVARKREQRLDSGGRLQIKQFCCECVPASLASPDSNAIANKADSKLYEFWLYHAGVVSVSASRVGKVGYYSHALPKTVRGLRLLNCRMQVE